MATLTRAGISAVLNLTFGEAAADHIRRDCLPVNLFDVVNESNELATWPVKTTGRSAGGAYAEGADMADADFDAHLKTKASLAIANYWKGVKISGNAMAAAAANGTRVFDSSLWNDELTDAVDDLAKDLSTDFYGGNVGASPAEIEGLERAITTGTYAGVNPATYLEFKSAVNTTPLASLSFKTTRDNLIRPFKDACGEYPLFVLCDSTFFDAYGDLFGDQRRYVSDVRSAGGGMVKLSGGFRALEMDGGVPLIEDRFCTSQTAYAFGRDAAQWVQQPAVGSPEEEAHLVVQAIKALTGTDLPLDEVVASIRARSRRLMPKIEMLGKTGDNVKAMVKVYAQLRVKRRNRTAKLTLT